LERTTSSIHPFAGGDVRALFPRAHEETWHLGATHQPRTNGTNGTHARTHARATTTTTTQKKSKIRDQSQSKGW